MKIIEKIKLVLFSGLLTGVLVMSGCGQQPTKTGPSLGPPEVGVVVIQLQRVALTTELPGRTSPYLVAEVRPQVSGIIQKRLFIEGTDVKAGQALYQIDPAPFEAAYASAKAAQAKAEANLILARSTERRYRELVKTKAVSQQDYDNAYSSLKQAEAELASAKAAVEAARINLGYTKITAPISGRIGRSSVTAGALVTANQPAALAIIQQLDPIYVDVTQSSAEMLRLKRDMHVSGLKDGGIDTSHVSLLLEDGSPYPHRGVLRFSEAMVDQGTGSVTMRAIFPNPEHLLLPGMFVQAVLKEGVYEQAILVPQRGVTRNPKGEAMVMVVGAGEKVEPRIIKVVRTVGDNWLVSEGLKAGDRVILEGIQKARPGTPVKAVPFGGKPAGVPPSGADKR